MQTSPSMPIHHLDTLWFQVSGTICNLTCEHCFISCSPKNKSFGFLDLATVETYLKQAEALGVKEFYFTGGEPFLNPDMVPILLRTLDFGPATVLTNATVLKPQWLADLHQKQSSVPYGLEFRVSLDGYNPATNDPIRGAGTFDRAIAGVKKLIEHGFLPIITATRSWPEEDDAIAFAAFKDALDSVGCRQPRLKILPTLKLGAQVDRGGGYSQAERVERWMLDEVDNQHFVCGHSRIVSDRGIHACPILLEEPEALLQPLHQLQSNPVSESEPAAANSQLSQSLRPVSLKHGACYTCYQFGAICSNSPSSQADTSQ